MFISRLKNCGRVKKKMNWQCTLKRAINLHMCMYPYAFIEHSALSLEEREKKRNVTGEKNVR